MKSKLKSYMVPVRWTATGMASVDASSAKEAIRLVEEGQYHDIHFEEREDIEVSGDPEVEK